MPCSPPLAAVRAPWRVQTVLQVLGVALLATASLVFLVFSWNVLSVAGRGAVIALGTVVVLSLAVWLLRRGLDQSAQAVGVLGAVLTVLDAWAIYAAGLAGDADPGGARRDRQRGLRRPARRVRRRRPASEPGSVTAALLLPLAPLMLLAARVHPGGAPPACCSPPWS